MKKIFSIVLVIVLAFTLCACDFSKIGTQADGDMPDLVIKATSPTEIRFDDRSQTFEITIEVDPSTVVGNELHYSWYIYAQDGSQWQDASWFVFDDPNTQKNDRPVLDQTITLYLDSNYSPSRPVPFAEGCEPGVLYKITCLAVNRFPGYENSTRKSSASVDFFIYVSPDLEP